MTGAGDLRNRYTFQRKAGEDDWAGHKSGEWAVLFTVWGGIRFMRGTEAVFSARLTARQPAILTVRTSTQTRDILPSDRAVDARTGEIFNIREKPREAKDNRGMLEMLVETGPV